MQLVDQKLGDYSTEAYLPFTGKQGEYLAADHPTWKERIAALLAYRGNILNLAGEFNWGFYLLQSYNFEKAAECFNDVTKIFPESDRLFPLDREYFSFPEKQRGGESPFR
jgi:hypothetical protein